MVGDCVCPCVHPPCNGVHPGGPHTCCVCMFICLLLFVSQLFVCVPCIQLHCIFVSHSPLLVLHDWFVEHRVRGVVEVGAPLSVQLVCSMPP